MDETWIKALGIGLAIIGAVVVYGAKFFVKRYGWDKNQKMNMDQLDETTLEKLKFQKAVAKVKAIGGLIFLPGMIIILFAFR